MFHIFPIAFSITRRRRKYYCGISKRVACSLNGRPHNFQQPQDITILSLNKIKSNIKTKKDLLSVTPQLSELYRRILCDAALVPCNINQNMLEYYKKRKAKLEFKLTIQNKKIKNKNEIER